MRRNSGIGAHGQESSWTWAGEVLLRNLPAQVRHVVVEVVGPLTLAIEQTRKDKSENAYPRFASGLDSPAPSYRLTLIGLGATPQPVVLVGWPPQMVEIENIAFGTAVGETDGEPSGHHGTAAGKRVELMGATNTIRNLSCETLVVREVDQLDLDGTVNTAEIKGCAGLTIRSAVSLGLGRLPPRSSLHLRDNATVTFDASAGEVGDITVHGGEVTVACGTLNGLTLSAVQKLTIGIQQTSSVSSSSATVLSLAGSVNALSLADGSSVLASVGQLQFDELRVGEHCDVFGISADRLRHQEIESLGKARQVALDAGTRCTFKIEATTAAHEGQPSIQRLADKRRRLLTLAIETHQSGHVQSVLREAERDARRRSLPKLSRERVALELWRSVTGHGERIAWPLVTASVAIVPLGIGRVGWAHFSSRAWWGGWSHLTSRLESFVNFALPGIDAIGLDGTTGIWGIAAKLCSVICLGAALNAARETCGIGLALFSGLARS
jgi:hypothetical protein